MNNLFLCNSFLSTMKKRKNSSMFVVLGLLFSLLLVSVQFAAADGTLAESDISGASKVETITSWDLVVDSATPNFPPPLSPSTNYCFESTMTINDDGGGEGVASLNFYLGANFDASTLNFSADALSPMPVGAATGNGTGVYSAGDWDYIVGPNASGIYPGTNWFGYTFHDAADTQIIDGAGTNPIVYTFDFCVTTLATIDSGNTNLFGVVFNPRAMTGAATQNFEAQEVVVKQFPPISLDKSADVVDGGSINEGDTVHYTIVLENTSDFTSITNIDLNDNLPSGVCSTSNWTAVQIAPISLIYDSPDLNVDVDNSTTTDSVTFPAAPVCTVADVNVRVNADAIYMEDVDMSIDNGVTTVDLSSDNCGTADSSYIVIFDDESTNPPLSTACTPPVSGNVQPEAPLSGLDGSTGSGATWTFTFTDDFAVDISTLNNWSLAVQCTESDTTNPTLGVAPDLLTGYTMPPGAVLTIEYDATYCMGIPANDVSQVNIATVDADGLNVLASSRWEIVVADATSVTMNNSRADMSTIRPLLIVGFYIMAVISIVMHRRREEVV